MVVKIASASAGCCPVRLKVNVSPRGRVQVICLTYMFGQSYQVSGICCHLIGSFSAGRTQSTVHDFAAARFTEVTSHSGSVSSSLTNSFPPPLILSVLFHFLYFSVRAVIKFVRCQLSVHTMCLCIYSMW